MGAISRYQISSYLHHGGRLARCDDSTSRRESRPDNNKLDGLPNALGWRLGRWDGVSVALILRFYPEGVETKKGNGAQGMVGPLQSLRERHEGNRVVAHRLCAARLILGLPRRPE
jgi:hypothetical protein